MEYETGWKATLVRWSRAHADRRLLQRLQELPGHRSAIRSSPVFGFEVNDPNSTKIYGLEAEPRHRSALCRSSGGVGLMHSSLGRFFATDPRILSLESCDPATGPAGPSCINLKGNSQTYAPNFTFNLERAVCVRPRRRRQADAAGRTSRTSPSSGRRCSRTPHSATVSDRATSSARSSPGRTAPMT